MILLKEIIEELKENASPATIISIKKFAPGAVKVYGVTNPVLNNLALKYKSGGFELVKALWNSGSYEERIIAAKMIRKLCMKDPQQALYFVEQFAGDIDNWALCDTLGMQSLKPVNRLIHEEIFKLATRLSKSSNMWERRLSLVLVEDFCKWKEFHPAIKQLISRQKNDKEYYIKKAVVWLERNLSKVK